MTDNTKSTRGRCFAELVQELGLDLSSGAQKSARSEAANDGTYTGVIGDDFFLACKDGERTAKLTRNAGYLLGKGHSVAFTTQFCLRWNQGNEPPLPEDKVRDTVASLARTHARNHPPEHDLSGPLFDLSAASVARFIGKEPPPRDWVLEQCLPYGKVGLLVAPGGTGKSQLVLQMAYDIATGRLRHSPWPPSKAGQIVLVGAEDEDDELHRRFNRLLRADTGNADAAEIVQALGENLYIVSRVAEDNLMTRETNGEVSQTGFVERLAKTLHSLPNLRVVVIDPVSRFRGGEENSAEDTTRFVEAVEKLAKLTGAAVLIVHHATKASIQGGEQNQTAARGSSALTDGVRLQINLNRLKSDDQVALGFEEDDHILAARITKTNYSAGGDQILLRRDDEGRLVRVDLDGMRQSKDDAAIDRLVDIIAARAADKVFYSKSSFAQAYAGRDNTFKMGQKPLEGLIERAIMAGRLRVEPGKQRTLRAVEPIKKAKVPLQTGDPHRP